VPQPGPVAGQAAAGPAWPAAGSQQAAASLAPDPGSPRADTPLPVAGSQRASLPAVAGQPVPARLPLVMGTLAALVATSVLLPVAGAAASLAVLILLRSADLTTGRLTKRRAAQGARRSDVAAGAAFYPWAVVRSVLRFGLLAPLALLCAAGAAALAVLAAGSSSLPKTGGYAAGALVACYCVGPGSQACRRPLSRFYGRITSSAPAAVLGSVALIALAAAAVVAAVTLTPGYWPDGHLGNQLQTTTIGHAGLNQVGRSLAHWLGRI